MPRATEVNVEPLGHLKAATVLLSSLVLLVYRLIHLILQSLSILTFPASLMHGLTRLHPPYGPLKNWTAT